MALRTATMATTTITSINVNPRWFIQMLLFVSVKEVLI